MKTIRYNPVVKNGRFEVSGFGKSFIFSRCLQGDAKYAFLMKFGFAYTSENMQALTVKVVRQVQRMYGFDNG